MGYQVGLNRDMSPQTKFALDMVNKLDGISKQKIDVLLIQKDVSYAQHLFFTCLSRDPQILEKLNKIWNTLPTDKKLEIASMLYFSSAGEAYIKARLFISAIENSPSKGPFNTSDFKKYMKTADDLIEKQKKSLGNYFEEVWGYMLPSLGIIDGYMRQASSRGRYFWSSVENVVEDRTSWNNPAKILELFGIGAAARGFINIFKVTDRNTKGARFQQYVDGMDNAYTQMTTMYSKFVHASKQGNIQEMAMAESMFAANQLMFMAYAQKAAEEYKGMAFEATIGTMNAALAPAMVYGGFKAVGPVAKTLLSPRLVGSAVLYTLSTPFTELIKYGTIFGITGLLLSWGSDLVSPAPVNKEMKKEANELLGMFLIDGRVNGPLHRIAKELGIDPKEIEIALTMLKEGKFDRGLKDHLKVAAFFAATGAFIRLVASPATKLNIKDPAASWAAAKEEFMETFLGGGALKVAKKIGQAPRNISKKVIDGVRESQKREGIKKQADMEMLKPENVEKVRGPLDELRNKAERTKVNVEKTKKEIKEISPEKAEEQPLGGGEVDNVESTLRMVKEAGKDISTELEEINKLFQQTDQEIFKLLKSGDLKKRLGVLRSLYSNLKKRLKAKEQGEKTIEAAKSARIKELDRYIKQVERNIKRLETWLELSEEPLFKYLRKVAADLRGTAEWVMKDSIVSSWPILLKAGAKAFDWSIALLPRGLAFTAENLSMSPLIVKNLNLSNFGLWGSLSALSLSSGERGKMISTIDEEQKIKGFLSNANIATFGGAEVSLDTSGGLAVLKIANIRLEDKKSEGVSGAEKEKGVKPLKNEEELINAVRALKFQFPYLDEVVIEGRKIDADGNSTQFTEKAPLSASLIVDDALKGLGKIAGGSAQYESEFLSISVSQNTIEIKLKDADWNKWKVVPFGPEEENAVALFLSLMLPDSLKLGGKEKEVRVLNHLGREPYIRPAEIRRRPTDLSGIQGESEGVLTPQQRAMYRRSTEGPEESKEITLTSSEKEEIIKILKSFGISEGEVNKNLEEALKDPSKVKKIKEALEIKDEYDKADALRYMFLYGKW
ncbi:MAG: hypothetical protein QW035_00685 [Candidatus Anstonellales archaeon]